MRLESMTVVVSLVLAALFVPHAGAEVERPSRADDESTWNEMVDGPLPRWREGGTPEASPLLPKQPYAVQLPQPADVPSSCQIESPPEYSPTEGVLLRYSTASWSSVVTDIVAALTGDPTRDEIAYVVTSSSSQQASAEAQFLAAGADLGKVQFFLEPTNSIWLRDYGPHFVFQGGARAVVDSHYYPGRPLDNFIPTILADQRFREPSYDIGLYYSGGNFQPGPERTGFTTSLVNLDNPTFSESFIGELYDTYQGIDTLHILPKLPGSVDGTGHIDMWFYLVDEDTVIISEFEPGSNATAIQITNAAVPYMEDLGFEVFRVPALNIGSTHYTYTNAFRVNDRIFIPTYGEGSASFLTRDAQALATWQAAAGPGVEIIGIDSWSIIPAAGAIHCIVMQVPRYDDTVPASCVTSPLGGETLVAGSDETIGWIASDDTEIDEIDLYYSLDGGPDVEIATGYPGNRDTFRWTVPQVESDTARVTVVARDEDQNSVVATSPADFEIATALRKTYDFSSGAGIDKRALGWLTSNWNAVETSRIPASVNTELSATNYSRIAQSDATGGDSDTDRYISPTPSGGSESTHVFEFTIEEDPSAIVDIALLWEGYADGCTQMELYVWDYIAGRWADGRGKRGENRFVDNFAGNEDEELSGNIRNDFDRFVDPSGQMTLLLYAERSGDESFHDYVSVTVTYEACSGDDLDFDGWGDVCDNCPTIVNLDQTDDDEDARGNICDCAPLDGSAFDVPFEVAALALNDTATLTWSSDAPNSGPGTVYDVFRGDVSSLTGLTGGYDGSCIAPGLAAVTLEDLETPIEGNAFYYLVRGTNPCGIGTFGNDSAGTERPITACP